MDFLGRRAIMTTLDQTDEDLVVQEELYIPKRVVVKLPPHSLLQHTKELVDGVLPKQFFGDTELYAEDIVRLATSYEGRSYWVEARTLGSNEMFYRFNFLEDHTLDLHHQLNKPKGFRREVMKAIRTINRLVNSGATVNISRVIQLCNADVGEVVNYFDAQQNVCVRQVKEEIVAVKYRSKETTWQTNQ